MRLITSFSCVLVITMLAGCQSATSDLMSADARPHAECLVCKKNADLACVDIVVDKDTPCCGYNGKTYYFCSDECRAKFQKKPAEFAGR